MDSYETILTTMKEKFKELSGYEVPDGTDIDIRMKVLAGELFSAESNLDFVKRQMFAQTATGEYLDLHAADRGLSRRPAVKAWGVVSFLVNEAREEPIYIPAGTVVSTSGSNPITFVTNNAVTLVAGGVRVSANCTAQVAGASGNVAPNAINLMVTQIVGIDRVINYGEFNEGKDEETDEELRARVLDSYINVTDGSNTAYYKKIAENIPDVRSAKVVPEARGAGTVDVNVCGFGFEVTSHTLMLVQRALDAAKGINLDVRANAAVAAPVSIGIIVKVEDGYSFNTVKNQVEEAIIDFINTREVGESIVDSQVGRVISEVEGVYRFRWGSAYASNYNITATYFAHPNIIDISEDQS